MSPRTTTGADSALVPDPPPWDERLWAAIGDPSRRRLLDVLLAEGGATANTLAGTVPFTRQAVSKHLGVLERAGLVGATRQGREVRYTVRADRLEEATSAMNAVASRWQRRLLTIKRIAEAIEDQAGTVVLSDEKASRRSSKG